MRSRHRSPSHRHRSRRRRPYRRSSYRRRRSPYRSRRRSPYRRLYSRILRGGSSPDVDPDGYDLVAEVDHFKKIQAMLRLIEKDKHKIEELMRELSDDEQDVLLEIIKSRPEYYETDGGSIITRLQVLKMLANYHKENKRMAEAEAAKAEAEAAEAAEAEALAKTFAKRAKKTAETPPYLIRTESGLKDRDTGKPASLTDPRYFRPNFFK